METPKTDFRSSAPGNGSVAQGVEHAGGNAHEAIDRVADAARPAVDRLATGAHQVVDKAKDVATHAAQALEAKADHLKEVRTHLGAACGHYLQTKPLVSLGIALGIGYLLSRLSTSK